MATTSCYHGRLHLLGLVLLNSILLINAVAQFHPPVYSLSGQRNCDYTDRPHKHYPVLNVTAESDYKYFVNQFNFEDAPARQFFIGAENQLLQMNMEDLTVNRLLNWTANLSDTATAADNTNCMMKTNAGIACSNHIRVYRKVSYRPDRMLVCGSFFTFPKCSTVGINSSGIDTMSMSEPTEDEADTGVVSIHPLFPNFGEFINMNDSDYRYFTISYTRSNSLGGDVFVLGYLNSSIDSENRITFNRLLKQSSEEFWLAVPNVFINYHSFNYDNGNYDVYYVFFREKRIANPSLGFTRVVQICKNDRGTDMPISGSRIFSSFAKANIICKRSPPSGPSALGALNIEYDVMRTNVLTPSKSRYQGNKNWNRLMYAIFTGPLYSFNGTAICVYEAEASTSDNELLGAFRDRALRDEGMMTSRTVLPCSEVRTDNTDLAMAIQSSSMVQQELTRTIPLLEVEDTLAVSLAVDQTSVADQADLSKTVQQDILFMGTEDGRILKMVQGTVAGSMGDSIPVISETIKLADNHVVRQMQIKVVDGTKFLYVSTFTRLYKIALYQCSKHTSCLDCIGARDPYCYWNTTSSTCVHYSVDLSTVTAEDAHNLPPELYQNVHTGESSHCAIHPSCSNIQASVSSPSNTIRVTGCTQCSYTVAVNVTIVGTTCGETPIVTSVPCINDLSITNSNILGLHRYRVSVVASNGSDITTYTRLVTTHPSAPQLLDASNNNILDARSLNSTHIQFRITLDGCQLTDVPDNYNFTINYDNGAGTSGSVLADYSNSNSVIVGGFRPCDIVQYNVVVINSVGMTTTSSNTSLAQGPPTVSPNSISILSPTSRSLTLTWSSPSMTNNLCDITGYSVYIGNEKQSGCSEVTGTSYTFEGLTPFTNYPLSVSACTVGGEGVRSAGITGMTLCEPPSSVRSLLLSANSSSTLQFTWVEPLYLNGSLGSYHVEQSCYNFTTFQLDTIVTTSDNSPFSISGLQPLTRCCITVSAVALCMGNSLRSSFRTECGETTNILPEPVQNLEVTSPNPTSLLVTWDTPTNYNRPGLMYTVMYGDTTLQTGYNHYYIAGLNQNTVYNVSVQARNSIGGSILRLQIQRTLANAPNAPSNVMLTSATNSITVAWNDDDATTFNVVYYLVRMICNEEVFVANTTLKLAAINIDNITGILSWCSAQVQGFNSIGGGHLSRIGQIVIPPNVPTTPRCFLVQNVSETAFFSFTVTDAISLSSLTAQYNITNLDTMQIALPQQTLSLEQYQMDGLRVSTTALARKNNYRFTLRLCNAHGCGGPCSVDFDINNVLPLPPTNLSCSSITYNSITVRFNPTQQANINYDVIFGNPISGTVTERTAMSLITRNNLLPRNNYTISVRAFDDLADLPGQESAPIVCRTSAGVPSAPLNVSATLNNTSIYIVWFPSDNYTGVIDGWHVAVGNAFGRDEVTCNSLYNNEKDTVMVIPNVRAFNYIANLPDVLSCRTCTVLFCVRSYNTEHESSWTMGLQSVEELRQGGLSLSNTGSLSSTVTALVVLSVLAIIAAIIIAIMLAIALVLRQKKLTPTEVYDDSANKQNSSVSSNQSKVAIGFMKRTRTPQRLASNASTRPMVVDGEFDFDAIKGTESDNSSSSQSMEEKCTQP